MSETAAGTAPQTAVMLPGGETKAGKGAAETVMVLLCVMVPLPHGSLKVHVSLYDPPHALELPVTTEFDVPLMAQVPAKPLL